MKDEPKWIEELEAHEEFVAEQEKAAEQKVDTSPETCCEYILYSIIQTFGGVRWKIMHDAADGRSWASTGKEYDDSIAELNENLKVAVDQTVRFGVEAPVRSGENDSANDSYWLWYRRWNKWIESLNDEHFRSLDEIMKAGHGEEIAVDMDVPAFLDELRGPPN